MMMRKVMYLCVLSVAAVCSVVRATVKCGAAVHLNSDTISITIIEDSMEVEVEWPGNMSYQWMGDGCGFRYYNPDPNEDCLFEASVTLSAYASASGPPRCCASVYVWCGIAVSAYGFQEYYYELEPLDVLGTVMAGDPPYSSDETYTVRILSSDFIPPQDIPFVSSYRVEVRTYAELCGENLEPVTPHSIYCCSLDRQYLRTGGLLDSLQNRTSAQQDIQDARVTGACADGTTELILMIDPSGLLSDTEDPSSIRLTVLPSGGKENGQLIGEGEDSDGDGYDDTPRIEKGIFTQTWRAPSVFDSVQGSSNTAKSRVIQLQIEVDTDGNGSYDYTDTTDISLARPPVAMVHGLWSNSGIFADLDTALANNGFMFTKRADYDNKASFDDNKDVVPSYIEQLQLEARRAGYARSHVDIVAHSMGGLLSKLIPYDLAQECVRKVITIGTPYEGSPWADLLWQARGSRLGTIIEDIICASLPVQRPAITGGAIEDLRTDPSNSALPVSTQVPGVDCETVVIGKGLYAGLPSWYRYFLCLLTGQWTAETIHTAIFGPNAESDWIVSVASQRYDAPTPSEISVLWHCTETSDTDFVDIVLNSLNQPAKMSSPALFAGSVTNTKEVSYDARPSETMPSIFNLSAEGEPNGTVEIVEPNEGQIVIPGKTLTISIEGKGDTNEAIVFAFFATESYANLVDLPWQDEVNVPTNSIGAKAKIIVVGLDPNRNLTAVDEANLILDSNVVLENMLFGFGDSWIFDFQAYPEQSHQLQLYPLGVFSDGSEHPLSVLSTQTTYDSTDEAVAAVDANGLVTARSRGSTEIIVANSGKSTTLLIEVESYKADIDLDGRVNFVDYAALADQWLQPPGVPSADIAPDIGDGMVNAFDLAVLAEHWLENAVP